MSRVTAIAIAIRNYWRNHPLLLIFAIAAGVFFAWPPKQVTELYRIFIVQELAQGAYFKGPFLAVLIAAVLPCFAIWYNSLCIDCQIEAPEGSESTTAWRTDRLLAVLIGLLPMIGLALGVWDARTYGEDHISAFFVMIGVAALVFVVLAELGRGLFWRLSLPDWLFATKAHRVLLVALALACLPFFITANEGAVSDAYSRGLRPLLIAGLFIALFATLISQAFYWKGIRLPVVTVLVALMVLTAFFGRNTHLRVAPVDLAEEVLLRPALPPKLPEPIAAPGAASGAAYALEVLPESIPQSGFAFKRWLDARQDKAGYTAREYPVFVVVAEGGGLYAAYHTAMFLARMQDRCTNFAQHLFGISGVSGGSLGGAVFSSLAKSLLTNEPHQGGCQPPPEANRRLFQDLTQRFFSEDLLSPLVGSAVFPDFFQLFLFNALPTGNRARALERSLEAAWDRVERSDLFQQARQAGKAPPARDNLFKMNFLAHWSAEGAAPALLMSTTEVVSGRRHVIGPMHDNPDRNFHLKVFPYGYRPDSGGFAPAVKHDVRLGTAIALSAAFPWISPASVFSLPPRPGCAGSEKGTQPVMQVGGPPPDCKEQTVRFVDGGYYESSGAEVINEIIAARPDLVQYMRSQGVALKFIVIRNHEPVQDPPNYQFHEWWVPLMAMLDTRASRGLGAFDRLAESQCGDFACIDFEFDQGGISLYAKLQAPIWSVDLGTLNYSFPLGWRLSDQTLSRIARSIGQETDCTCVLKNGKLLMPIDRKTGTTADTQLVAAKGCGLSYAKLAFDVGSNGTVTSPERYCKVVTN